jgi:integrase
MVEGNPAVLLEIQKIVAPDYNMSDERTRVLTPSDLKELRQIFLSMEKTYETSLPGAKYGVPRPFKKETQLAIWICLSTLCRIGELLKSEWKDVDFEKGVWYIPVENVKETNGKKQSQTVSLSHLSLEQFKELNAITGHSPYCFPAKFKDGPVNEKTVSKLVGDSQTQFKSRSKPLKNRRNDNSLVLNGGKDGEWTPHDMRRTGATMMQALGVNLDVIDLCQNHILGGSRVRKSYLHHDYLEEKRSAWAKLGFQLESIFSDQH